LYDQAICEVGLSAEEFEDMEWVNYQRKVINHYSNEAKEWERTRTIYSILYNTHSKIQMKPELLIPLWKDKTIERKKITTADRDRVLEAIKRTEEWKN